MSLYVSTRGEAPRLSFAGVTLAGLASDGGLYVPESLPRPDLAGMAGQSYVEAAWHIMRPFVGEDIPSADLVSLLRAAYKKFDSRDVAPLRKLDDGFYVMELFHGPTLAFKDVALQFLGQVFDYLLDRRKQRVTIVGATSGDTGSAAIEAFRGKKSAGIVILHPHNRVSEVQRRQMTTVPDSNVFNIAVEGSFDDCQDLVKALFADKPFRDEMHLSAVNSINWARILAQVVYYAHAAARLQAETGKRATFCVPTGNFGNIYAGYIAKQIGAPVGKLLAATNANDILHRFFTTGRMKAEGVTPTLSPSMDIQVSSNFERLLFQLFGMQGEAVAQTLTHFRKGGSYQIDDKIMARLRETFGSGRVDDAQTADIIRRTYTEKGYLVDPHTAVGVGVAEDFLRKNPDSLVVTLATAHPAKFPAAVEKAAGVKPPLPSHLADLYQRPERYKVLPANLDKVKDFIRGSINLSL